MNSNFENHIRKYLDGQRDDLILQASRYALEGGKRFRPRIIFAILKGMDLPEEIGFDAAMALEFIQTYSLIHDDLPAMDDDDLRRGKPTNHKVFGEAMAILAGDGLISTAAETVTGCPLEYYDDPVKMKNHVRAAHEIMSRAGARGMIAGQTADIKGEKIEPTDELIKYIELHKTADLITAPVRAGIMLAGADDDMLEKFTVYARDIGVAFQILDDILDIEGDQALLGKTLGKDAEQGKCNYAFVHGPEAARAELHRLTSEAKEALSAYGDAAAFFTALADSLEIRKY